MTAAKKSPAKQPRKISLWLALALVAGTLLVYWPVTRFQFVNFDDTDFVTANPHVQAGFTFDSFKWAWHSEVARNWHPITMLTHMMDCQLFGLNAGRHHLVNLIFHIANALLLFHLLKLLTGKPWRSAFIAALFAWHPLHVESVAWIAERKDVLSTFFWFLTMWAYVGYAREKSKMFYAFSLSFFALGLMSKPMLVTGPFVLLLLDFWPLERIKKQKLRMLRWEKVPFLAMSLVLCVITYLIQKHGGAMLTDNNLPLPLRIENALVSYIRYIGKMFWPADLNGLYLRSGQWPLWQVSLSALILISLSIIAFAMRQKRPWFLMGWLWYLGTLVPVIGVVQVGMQTMADRFTYVPLVGLFIVLTWGACEIAQHWRLPDFVLPTAAALVLTACLILTARQVGYWKNSETLFQRMIAVDPKNYMAHYNLANFYAHENRAHDAATHYKAALEAEPNYADAHNNFAGLLLDEKNYDEAIQNYRDALRINPQYLYYFNLANALADAASARHDASEFAEAVQTYRQALALNPTAEEAHNNLGLTWDAQGREGEAIAEFREAIRLKPAFESAHLNLANALARVGKLDDAAAEYNAVLQLNPNNAEGYSGLGICNAMQNKMDAAAQQFKVVIRLQPGNAAANGNLGNALAAENKMDEAIPYYLAAIRLNPSDYQSEFNLGLTLSRQGKYSDAEDHYRNALRINPNYTEATKALQDIQNRIQR